MSSRSDCKSVQEVYYKHEDGRDHASSCDQTNPLAPISEPEPTLDVGASSITHTRTLFLPPRRLALCGGGVRCIAHVGVFKALQELNLLTCVKEVIGISAGALFALMYCCGYTLEQIEQLAIQFDFSLLRNIDPESAFLFPTTLGLDSGEGLERFLTSILVRSGLKEGVTFQEMARQRPQTRLKCFATDIQTSKVREFSLEASPHISVKFAVRASMSLPILYTPVKDPQTGHYLMDGGILHNLPLAFLHESHIQDTLAVLFTVRGRGDEVIESEIDVLKFFQHIYDSITSMRNKVYLERFPKQVVCVPVKGTSVTDFEPTKEMRQQLIQIAFDTTLAFVKKAGTKPFRRYSVS